MSERQAKRAPRSRGDLTTLNHPSVDFLLLADRAEALNGKLYMMGGAWDRIFVPDLKGASPISLAVAFLIPWNATNQQHTATVGIEDPDNKSIGFGAEVGFNAGRPPWAEHGQKQRVVIAFPLVPVTFPRYGTYYVKVHINGVHDKTVEFQVVPPPAAQFMGEMAGSLSELSR